MTDGALTDERRVELQRRTLRTLTVGQVVGSASMSSAVTVGAYVIQEILGQKTPWGGIATATVTMGGAVTAEIVAQTKGDKVIIFKKKRRHNYRRRNGHRQQLTVIKITSVA